MEQTPSVQPTGTPGPTSVVPPETQPSPPAEEKALPSFVNSGRRSRQRIFRTPELEKPRSARSVAIDSSIQPTSLKMTISVVVRGRTTEVYRDTFETTLAQAMTPEGYNPATQKMLEALQRLTTDVGHPLVLFLEKFSEKPKPEATAEISTPTSVQPKMLTPPETKNPVAIASTPPEFPMADPVMPLPTPEPKEGDAPKAP